LLLQGTQAALSLRSLSRLTRLQDAEFKVFSQWGEDGMIEWLVARLPGIPQRFIEFGVENYTEANTRFLLMYRNWRGLVIDGSPKNVAAIRRNEDHWKYDLTAISAFITQDNINALISNAGFSGDIGLLSVDIDGNDYWVWEAISSVTPWIVIIEYNAVFGDLKPLTIPYDPGFTRMTAHHSALYYGASVLALEQLAARKGYILLGSNRAGNNLFFLRQDAMAAIAPLIADRQPSPSLYAEARSLKGELSLIRGTARRNIINDMFVTNVATGITAPLEQMGDLYSPGWIEIQQGNNSAETLS